MSYNSRSHMPIVIIALAVAALIMGLFLNYHFKHQPIPHDLGNGRGLIFNQAKELKPFSLVQYKNSTNAAFTKKNLMRHWTIVFFGFSNCNSVCPVTMQMLSEAYPELIKIEPNLKVILVSLDPDRDSPQIIQDYAAKYNRNFIGISGAAKEIHKLQSQLGIASDTDSTTTDKNYQIVHTSSIILLNPKGEWIGLFRFGMSAIEFTKVFAEGRQFVI